MNERVWVKWSAAAFALALLHTCLGQKDCTGVDCPRLDGCIEEVLESGACCATCLQRGCTCEGYQYYDCISAGFKNGKVPEGESYLVDSGSTECRCPTGGSRISCRFIPCPDVPPHCIEMSDSTEVCPHCLRVGCVYQNQKYEAGHSFHMDQCQVCHCPNDGGDLTCSMIPDCSLETVKKPEVKKNKVEISKHEKTNDFPIKGNTLPSNSVPIYTENTSELEESEDDDYFPETTASPDAFVTSSVVRQAQNPHEVQHEDTRDELRETLSTYEVDSRETASEESRNVTTVRTDLRSSEKLASQTETSVGPISRETASDATDDIQRTKKNPDNHRNLPDIIPELNTAPKLHVIFSTSPPVNMREHEGHRQPQTLGRYQQERNDLQLTPNNQRGE